MPAGRPGAPFGVADGYHHRCCMMGRPAPPIVMASVAKQPSVSRDAPGCFATLAMTCGSGSGSRSAERPASRREDLCPPFAVPWPGAYSSDHPRFAPPGEGPGSRYEEPHCSRHGSAASCARLAPPHSPGWVSASIEHIRGDGGRETDRAVTLPSGLHHPNVIMTRSTRNRVRRPATPSANPATDTA